MNKKVSQWLLTLSHLDEKILTLNNQKNELLMRREVFVGEISERRERLKEAEVAHKEGRLKQVFEEHRLRDEELKIVERRKKLSSIAGAKVAKLLEREIDIASRTLQALEEQAVKALEDLSSLENQLSEQKSTLEQLETQFELENQDIEKNLTHLEKDLNEGNSEREGLISNLDERLARLYRRVRSRYVGSAIAVAANGSCRSCYRALPPQTYNQILAGNNLIQCPGCSRLLVYVEHHGA